MGKLLRLRDYILIAAAAASEVFEDIRLVGGIVPKVMEGTYGFVPAKYRHSSYSSTVSQMLSTGDIRKIINRQGEVQLELTSVGEQQFKRRFKLFLQTHKWDGLFMMVIFDIAEKNRPARDQFRRKLEELGFGMLQKSVWISPYHLVRTDMLGNSTCFTGSYSSISDFIKKSCFAMINMPNKTYIYLGLVWDNSSVIFFFMLLLLIHMQLLLLLLFWSLILA